MFAVVRWNGFNYFMEYPKLFGGRSVHVPSNNCGYCIKQLKKKENFIGGTGTAVLCSYQVKTMAYTTTLPILKF